MIFKIIFIHNLTSICYCYDIEYPMVSYEKLIPLSVQLASFDEQAKYLDDNRMHKLDQNLSPQKRGAEKSLFNQLKSFLSHIDSQIEILCFKSHVKSLASPCLTELLDRARINMPTRIEKCYLLTLFFPFESAHLF